MLISKKLQLFIETEKSKKIAESTFNRWRSEKNPEAFLFVSTLISDS